MDITAASTRPLPHIDPINEPYFKGAREGRLLIQRCRDCGSFVFFPRIACPTCLSAELEWRQAAGKGVVYSFCVVHRPQHPAFYDEVPIIFAAVALLEGPVMLSEIRNIEPEKVRIDMPVEVDFVALSPEVCVPVWGPIKGKKSRATR
jgi:uncharacterized OB-fold protein